MTILTVQLIVEFSKRVPGFDTLLREDQITLLKVSYLSSYLVLKPMIDILCRLLIGVLKRSDDVALLAQV